MSSYSEKLKDPRWQKKRLEVLERDGWQCQHRLCGDKKSTLFVHHLYYEKGREPWEYPLEAFITFCGRCHAYETEYRQASELDLLQRIKQRGYMVDDLIMLTTSFGYNIPDRKNSLPLPDPANESWMFVNLLADKELQSMVLNHIKESLKKDREIK